MKNSSTYNNNKNEDPKVKENQDSQKATHNTEKDWSQQTNKTDFDTEERM